MSIATGSVGEAGVEVTILDKLTADDYRQFREATEACFERREKINLMVVVKNFSGWTPGALWEDLKFDVSHYNDVARLAIVGADPSQHWMAAISKPFTSAAVKYYTFADIDAAREWVGQAPDPDEPRST